MKTFVLFGVRVLSERSWNATIDDAARDRALRLELEEKLRTLATASTDFNATVEEKLAEQRKKNEEIRAVVETTLSCNVRLARRAEEAEHQAALLRDQLTKMLRRS